MRVAPHIRASVTADGILFLDIASGRMFAANAIGAHIWNRLREGSSEEVGGQVVNDRPQYQKFFHVLDRL